jgi:hypothetical protein
LPFIREAWCIEGPSITDRFANAEILDKVLLIENKLKMLRLGFELG